MKRLKAIFLLSLFACVSLSMSAKGQTTLTVTLTNGQKQHISLYDAPLVTMDDTSLSIKTEKLALQFSLDNVETFTYDDTLEVSGIMSIGADGTFCQEGEFLLFGQSTVPRHVLVSNVSGIVVESFEIKAGEAYSFSLERLPKGVYIISVDGLTTKFIRQ